MISKEITNALIAALTNNFGEYVVNKAKELTGKRFKLALEVKQFVFGSWVDKSTALLALVELTNLSEEPFSISEMQLSFGDNTFRNRPIKLFKRADQSWTVLEIITRTHEKAILEAKDWECDDVINRPYLLPHQTIAGVVAFKIQGTIEPDKAFVKAKIGGFGDILEAPLF